MQINTGTCRFPLRMFSCSPYNLCLLLVSMHPSGVGGPLGSALVPQGRSRNDGESWPTPYRQTSLCLLEENHVGQSPAGVCRLLSSIPGWKDSVSGKNAPLHGFPLAVHAQRHNGLQFRCHSLHRARNHLVLPEAMQRYGRAKPGSEGAIRVKCFHLQSGGSGQLGHR